MTRDAVRMASALLPAALLAAVAHAHHDELSRHFIAEALPMTDVVVAAAMTEGPFFGTDDDYIAGPDMTAAGRAGADGVGPAERAAVADGVPLWLTLNVYQVSRGAMEAVEFAAADVYLWHCDAVGVYSAVASEGTAGQKWLRGVQTTGTNGSVTFRTILPGWYPGRTVHFHLRVRQAGATSFAVTTQLFLDDAFVTSYKSLVPYSQHAAKPVTTLMQDGIYMNVPAGVREKLVLNASGSNAAGYTASFNLGVQVATPIVTAARIATTSGPAPFTTAASLLDPLFTSAAGSAAWFPNVFALGIALLFAIV